MNCTHTVGNGNSSLRQVNLSADQHEADADGLAARSLMAMDSDDTSALLQWAEFIPERRFLAVDHEAVGIQHFAFVQVNLDPLILTARPTVVELVGLRSAQPYPDRKILSAKELTDPASSIEYPIRGRAPSRRADRR